MKTRISQTLSNKQEFWAATFTGEVIEANRQTHTHIHQTPGHSMGTRGYIPGTVYSTQSTSDEVWLRDADGVEQRFELGAHAPAMRVGHKVTVLWGAASHVERGPYLGIYNHTSGERVCSIKRAGAQYRSVLGIKPRLGGHLLGWATTGAALAAFGGVAAEWSRWALKFRSITKAHPDTPNLLERAIAKLSTGDYEHNAQVAMRVLDAYGHKVFAMALVCGAIGAVAGLVVGIVGKEFTGFRKVARIEADVDAFFAEALDRAVTAAAPAK